MNNKKYDEIINDTISNKLEISNVLVAFFSGGLCGLFSQLLVTLFINSFNCNLNDAYLYIFMILVFIGCILTGFGVFDKILSICKCGLIVPSTGFANAMTSSSMDYKGEGFVKGIGSNIFKLTGSIILYGVVFGIIFGYIRSIIL